MAGNMLEVKQQLRAAGFAPTRQRLLVMQSMRGRTDHPDAESVLTDLREILPSFSTDTVYRTLNAFAERGLIRRLPLPLSKARFDGNVDPHDHFLCKACGLILNLPEAADAPIVNAMPVDRIAQIHSVQRIYDGVCRDCMGEDNDFGIRKQVMKTGDRF